MADGEDAEGNLAAGAGVPEGQHPESGPADPVSEKSSFWRRVGRIAKWTGIGTAVLAALGALTVFFVIRHYEAGLPSVEQLKKGYDPPQVTRILARDGTLLANLFTERRTVIPLSEVPDHVKLAFLAAEDASFYEHAGLNYLGMLRALVANLRAGHTTQGGSTITQQVVKNLLLDPERTYSRKIKETILARRMEQDLTKDEIFNLYLNHIYLGHGRYGIEEAARYYFGKKAKELDLAEGALLAGLVASPEHWSPRRAPDKAMARRRYVLGQMLEKGFVTRQLYEQAMKEPLRLAPAVEAESELAPEIVDYVKGILEQVGGKRARHGGYKVTTTIDPTLQAEARKAVRDNLERYAERQKLEPPFTLEKRRLWGRPFQGTPKKNHIYVGTVKALDDDHHTIDVQVGDTLGRVKLDKEERYDPRHLPPSKFAAEGASLRVSLLADPAPDDSSPVPLRLELGPESALVAIDVRTRQVRALIGSYEALMGGLDRATQSRRQPGSAFKPFVYSYALHSRRFTPATVLELPARHGKPGETRHISVRMALAKSDNAAAQYIFRQVGPANVVQWAHALGIESKLQPDVLACARCVRGQADRDCCGLPLVRQRRHLCAAGADHPHHRAGRQTRGAAKGAAAAPRDVRCRGVPDDQPDAERGAGGDRAARQQHGPPAGRQDRHDQRCQGCVVRRFLDRYRHFGVGRLRRCQSARLGRGGRGNGVARLDAVHESGREGAPSHGVCAPR